MRRNYSVDVKREVVALAHVNKDRVEAAYLRSDYV
jgi:hypothetical protein